MTREVRKVSADWQHPSDGSYTDGQIRYVPLYEGSAFASKAAKWDEGASNWARDKQPESAGSTPGQMSYAEWAGPRPRAEEYMPAWSEADCTHFMMYELSTEGTPVSPAFANIEELATWLTQNKVCLYADEVASYEQWLRICKGDAVSLTLLPR